MEISWAPLAYSAHVPVVAPGLGGVIKESFLLLSFVEASYLYPQAIDLVILLRLIRGKISFWALLLHALIQLYGYDLPLQLLVSCQQPHSLYDPLQPLHI